MKVKSFKLVPILALFVCCLTNAFADDSRSNVKINPATPMSNEYRDDGVLDGRRGGWTWHGDQGLYNFTTIKNFPSDELNQKPIVRFGGAGTYVFGDYAVTGKPVISLDWSQSTGAGQGYMWGAKGTYIKDDPDGRFYLNSSKAVLRLPKGVTKKDIVYARLYWQGNIFSTTDFDSKAEYNSKDGKKETGFAKWYTWVKFTMKSSKGKASVIEDIQRDRCEGTAAWNFLASSGRPLRLRLKYGCTKDITDKVKEYFVDYSDSIEFTVGNVRTSDGMDPIGADFTNGEFDSARIGPYGGWGIIVVYDKTANSRRDLLNNLQSNDSVTGQKMTYKEAVEYKNKYFKPKNVTIYGDYLVVTPWNNGYTPININATISGFYTPKSGTVNAKLGFLGFGGERKMTSNEYFKVQYKGTARMDSLYGSDGVNQWLANDRANIYDGSVALLINDNGTYKYSYPHGTGYLGGFDLDEFDIGSKMKNAQSSLNISLGAAWENLNGGQADQNFISMIAISADLYVPQMCYQYEVYNASNWVKFFDNDGNRRSEEDVKKLHEPPEQIKNPVVAGEHIYYRMKFENRLNGGNSEDAVGAVVSIDFAQAGAAYTKDSSTINNELAINDPITTTTNTIPAAAAEKLVYLRDGQKGAYKTMKDVINGGTPNVTDPIYNDRQFTTLDNNVLKFYIGEGAGEIKAGTTTPVGGLMRPGKAAYGEFNATVNTGAKILQAPAVTLSYKMSLDIGGGQRVVLDMDSASELELCDATKVSKSVDIQPLSGLQVVNKNFSNSDDDDRLYTQISDKPFDAKLIFRPDYESQYCKSYDDKTGKCTDYIGAAANSPYFKKDPNTGKLVYIGSKDRKLEKFGLGGKLYLSVIRAKNAATTSDKVSEDDKKNSVVYACRSVTDTLKIPFKLNGDSYSVDKELDFKNKSILTLNNIEIGDAYQGLTFMLSYRPDEQATSRSDLDKYIKDKDLNSEDPKAYYLELKKWELKKQYGYCEANEDFDWCNKSLTAEQKKDIWDNIIQKKLDELKNSIDTASNEFGIKMSKDGSFHICGSDNFVLRPAYFKVDTDALNNSGKYSKIVDTTASGDITKKGVSTDVYNPTELRVGGDYEQNADILAHVISARSYSDNGVPNYTARIGGDLGNQRYHLRKSYGTDSDDTQDISTKIRGIQTYLRPFISNECMANVDTQSYYVDRKTATTTLKRGVKQDGCYGGTAVEYSGAKYNAETGKYEIDPSAIKKGSFGKSDDVSCVLNGTISKFDASYRRVWDKNAVSLWADFNARDIVETGGVAKFSGKGNSQGAYLMTQSRKASVDKDKENAVIYTEGLGANADKIFNYYNVGDVLVNIYDNSWTDAYSDQTYSKKWKSAKCIINSSSNTPDAKGMVGCDVGMRIAANKDKAINDNIVLRYKPDRIRVSLVSLDNGITTGVGDNNITGGTSAYTYFNDPYIENNVVVYPGENPAQNLAVTRQISQLAKLKVNAVAYLSDKVYKDVIATLYDGYKQDVSGTPQAVCGFSSDLDFALNFGFDCASNSADGRCSTAIARRTGGDTNYVPYPNRPTVVYNIPGGTQFFARNSNDCLGPTGYDSRCYTYNARTLSSTVTGGWEEAASAADTGYGLPIPLRTALNYYSDASLIGGLINRPRGGTGINYDSKSTDFRILAQGFREGQTPGSTVYFNFARMHKTPSTPVLIYASDFDIRNGTVSIAENFWPSKFDKSYNAISDTTSEQYKKDDIKLSQENFNAFITRKVSETKAASKAAYIAAANSNSKTYATGKTVIDYSDNVGTYALFVYGTSYDKSLGSRVYQATTRTGVTVPIYTQIYCGRTDRCANMPAPSAELAYEAPGSNIFTVLAAQDHSLTDFTKFVVNTRATLNNIGAEFVSAYTSFTPTGVTVRRGNVVSGGKEDIAIQATVPGQARIRIETNPWLIHTPAENQRTMFTVPPTTGAYSSRFPGVPQYFNPLTVNVRAVRPTVWGGEGQVKSGTVDDVGSFAGGSTADNSTSDTSTSKLGTGDIRDIYNQKTDW